MKMPFTFSTKNLPYVFPFVIFAAIFSFEIANATIYYVATGGSDSNPGTSTQPLRTIKKGIQSLSAGDTLYVKSGTYAESLRTSGGLSIPNGTSWSNPITIAANPGDIVTIKPLKDNAGLWILDGQSKYLIIKGFIIDGGKSALHGIKLEGGTRYVRVIDCEVKNSKNSGILLTGSNDSYHEFINVKIHHNGSSNQDHGFYFETGRNLVEKSEIYSNSGYGGHIYKGTSATTGNNNTIRNNIFHDNNTLGSWGCGLLISSGNGTQAYNNIAYGNFAGFCIFTRVTNARLFNNISYENDTYGIYVGYSTTSGTTMENNTLYNNGTYGIFVGNGATISTARNNIAYSNNINLSLTNTTSSNNLTTDPSFVNAGGKNFHLQSTSNAIDKGTTISGITIDHDGKPRPKGSQFDVGAYEYQGSASTSSSTSTSTSTTTSTSSSSTTSTTTNSYPPPITSPAPGGTLTTSTVVFTGAHTSQDYQHWVTVGTSPGGSQFGAGSPNANHQFTASGLPSTGTIYVRYYTRTSSGSNWESKTYSYLMNVK